MFIVLEGIDGCGKSTQAKLLYDWMVKNGKRAELTAEPTKDKIGILIREILSGNKKIDPKTLALLFTADRSEHLRNFVEPNLSKGKIVISERYYHSTIAYQSAQGVDRNWIIELNSFARKPDLIIFLDIKPEIAIKRKGVCDFFENSDFLEKVYAEYIRLYEIPRNFVAMNLRSKFILGDMKRVDASQSVEKVFEDIKKILEGYI